VFQSLVATLGFAPAQWRFLDNCHQKRNVALYDGEFAEDEKLIDELIAVCGSFQIALNNLRPINQAGI